MDKDVKVKVANRGSNRVGYTLPELHVRRQFTPRATKEVSYGELEELMQTPGGETLIKRYLVIKDKDVLKELGLDVEPEYFYTEKEVKKLLQEGSMNEFLDCLDFAPEGVLDIVKEQAVSLPLNDVSKRNAILRKTGFDVNKAIEIKNSKSDEELEKEEANGTFKNLDAKPKRRVAEEATDRPKRRTTPRTEVTSNQD